MPTGSFPEAGFPPLSDGKLVNVFVGGSFQHILTYPRGYSGSVSREFTPTGSEGSGSAPVPIPTVGQLWPRGNRTVV
jgi:hypothetical protein